MRHAHLNSQPCSTSKQALTILLHFAVYNINNIGSNTCSGSYILIDNEQQCSATAGAVGAYFRGAVTTSAYPKGCIISQDKGTVYFNQASVGTAHAGWGPVCFIPQPCNASVAPPHGGVGSCTSHLPGGSTCQPICEPGFTVSGASSCSTLGVLTAARCISGSTHWGQG